MKNKMRRARASIYLFLTIVCTFMLTSCNLPKCSPHDYQIVESVAATCIEQGSITYRCTKCGDEYTNPTDIDPTRHSPGPEATTESPQVCLDCGTLLHEPLSPAPVVSTRSLAINHYAGVATSYCMTRIDTQVHSKYTLPTQHYYDADPNEKQAKPLDLDVSLPIQEFYSHDIHSVYSLDTADGKTFTTAGGFKVDFNINGVINNKKVEDLNASKYGDFLENFDSPAALRIVRIYQSSAAYGGLYEVVDFSNSFVEIEKDGVVVSNISLWNEEQKAIKTNIEISEANGRLFDEEGTYRILFKYGVAWVSNPTSAVYDAQGNKCYPYGFLNDQYDYFYVTITDEKAGILVPDDFGTEAELFYQLRADSVSTGELFLETNGTINFGSQPKLYIDTVLDSQESSYSFKGNALKKFQLSLYRYDYDSDTGEDGTDPYVLCGQAVDLLPKLTDEDTFELVLEKNPQLRGNSCRIVVESELFHERTSQTITLKQVYSFTFDWE